MAYYRRGGYRRSYRRPPARRSYSMYRRAPSRRPATRRRRTTRTTRGRTGVAARGCACPSMLTAGDKWSLAQVDPFNPRAFGGKIPDSNTVPSCSVALQDLVALPLALVSDTRCFAFLPRVQRGRTITSTGGAAAWTWPAAYAGNSSFTKATDYAAAYELDRPVAHAIRLSSAVPPTTAQGFVHIAIAYESFAENGATTWPWPTTVADLGNYQFYKRVTLASLTQSPLVVVNKYMDETAFRYSSTSDITGAAGAATGTLQTFHTFFSWGAILVALEGVNSLAPLNCEVLLHTEAIPKQSGAVTGTPAAVANSTIMGATSYMVSNTPESFNQQEHDSYLSRAQTNFQAGLQQAGNYAGQEVRRRGESLARDLFQAAIGGLLNGGRGIGGVNDNPDRLMLHN